MDDGCAIVRANALCAQRLARIQQDTRWVVWLLLPDDAVGLFDRHGKISSDWPRKKRRGEEV